MKDGYLFSDGHIALTHNQLLRRCVSYNRFSCRQVTMISELEIFKHVKFFRIVDGQVLEMSISKIMIN